MYIHLNLIEKDMIDPHINFQTLKCFKYLSQLPAYQKLQSVGIMHHHCIKSGSMVISSQHKMSRHGFVACFNTWFAVAG